MEFLGQFLGWGIRSMSPLPIDLHPIVWKHLCYEEPNYYDLQTSDVYKHQQLEQIKQAAESIKDDDAMF